MKEWLKKNQIIASRFMGMVLLLVGLGAFFWVNNSGSSVSLAEQRATERITRMEARISGASSSNESQQKAKPDYTLAYSDHSQEQMKFMLIIMMILGAVSLVYSFIKKES